MSWHHNAEKVLAILFKEKGIIEILPQDLSSGLHIAVLYFDGILIGSAKIQVMN